MADLPSIAEAIEKALAELDGPIPYEAFIARVLEIRPSKAKRPAQSIKNELRYGWQDRLIVSENTVMPTHIALQAEGRKVVAVYVCETCSEDRRPVYICEDHAVDLHNDHWTGELLY
jgi:hypothetical protein